MSRYGRVRQSRGNSSVRLLGGDVVVVYFIGLGPLMKATGFSEHRRRPRTVAWFGTSRKPEHDNLWLV
jgi:hypothetical protein